MTVGRPAADDQFPILCATCAGPATPLDDLTVRCDFCGKEERLPATIAERNRELRRRVTAAARSALQLKGLQGAMASMFEKKGNLLFSILPYLVLPVAILGLTQLNRLAPAYRNIPAEYRSQINAGYALAPTMMLGFPIALVVAWLYARTIYRRKVRPLMMGLPPKQPGMPARCRSCCGDLVETRGPFVPCRYCGVHNLLSKEAQGYQSQLAAKEVQAMRDQTRVVTQKTAAMAGNLNLAFGATFAVVYVLTLVAMRLFQG